MTHSTTLSRASILLFVLALAACQPPPTGAPPPPEVQVLAVHAQDLPLSHDMVGRLAPTRIAEVRARVTGIVLDRVYDEGSHVEAGQLLFRIDPAPLKAELAEKQAALNQAQVTADNNRARATRVQQLAERGVVSKQDLDDANAEARSSRAAVAKARAAAETAKLNLSYTKVTAPIAGRAGRALVTAGALVSQSSATQMTTIDQIDPLYVNFSQPLEVVTAWREARANGRIQMDASQPMRVHVTLPDGADYPQAGALDFTDMRVDPETGSVSLRATIANAEHRLLPGTFVNVHLDAGILQDVMLIPQEAVLRDGTGAYVLTVGDDDTVSRMPVETRGTHRGDWIVDQGLSEGQRVIVSGVQHARPGSPVRTVPWSPDSSAAAPAASTSP